MADPLRTEDFPEFDTYPGPESPEKAGESPLRSAAEQIGSTMGRAVRAARELPDRADQLRVDLRDRLTVIRGGGGRTTADQASDLQEKAKRKLEEGKQRAARLARQARARAVRLADERPLQVLLGACLAGVIAGVTLRLWRNRE